MGLSLGDIEKAVQVSIVIVNYNTRALLRDCIRSIHEHTHDVAYEIIVVDNDSTDSSVEMLREEYPSVVTIASNENLGFGKANNAGVKHARGEYLFFLNSDTLLVNNAIAILHNFISHHEEVGVCGACLYDKDLRPNLSVVHPPSSWDELCTLLPKFLQKKQDIACYHGRTTPLVVDCITGADMMVRKEAFLTAGQFDPDFFLYAEEVELTHRIKQRGYRVYLVPEAKIIHLEGMSANTKVLNERVAAEKMYSKFVYYWKVYGRSTARQVYFYLKLKCISALVLFSIACNETKRNYWRQKYQLLESSYKRFKALPR